MAPVTMLVLLGLLAQSYAQLSVKLFPRGSDLGVFPTNNDIGNFIINSDGMSCPASGVGAFLSRSDFKTFESNSLNLKEMLKCLEVLPAESCANGSTIPSSNPKLSVGLVEGATRQIPIVNTTSPEGLYFHFRVSEFCIGRLSLTNATAGITGAASVQNAIAIQSNHPALTLSLGLVDGSWGTLRYVTAQGVVREGAITVSGDAATIQQTLANVTFTPSQLSGALQYINVTLSSQSQALYGKIYIAIAAANTPANTTVSNDTSSEGPPVVTGNANGKVSSWHTIRGDGNVADYHADKIAQTRSALAQNAGVSSSSFEIGAIQPGSVLIYFRFLGLDDSQIAAAVQALRANCLQSGLTGFDCNSITAINSNTIPAQSGTTDNSLSAGAIVGIVIGSVVAGVIALALVLFGLSRSRKSSAGVAKNTEDPVGYTEPVTGITYLPPAALEAPYPTPTSTPVIGYR